MFKPQGELSRMKRRIAFALIAVMFMLSTSGSAQAAGYSSYIESGESALWSVEVATNFRMWFTEGGWCAIENESSMIFDITDVDEEISGVLSIGNVTVSTNDSLIASDLVLGVWPAWLPGLFIEVGQSNIESLNETAYAAAERVSGNWMNGTMTSRYENISVGNTIQECIVFDYEQDPTGYGEPQVTHLAYSLASGALVEADTSVTFDNPFKLVLSLVEVGVPSIYDFTVGPGTMIIVTGIIGGGMLAAIVIVYVQLGRRG